MITAPTSASAPPTIIATEYVIPLAPDAPLPAGYVLVQHEAGRAAVRPDPSCNRCSGSPLYRHRRKVVQKHGEDPRLVVNCCRCVSQRLGRAVSPAPAVDAPVVTSVETLVAPAGECDHDAEARRVTALQAQLAGIEGRLAAAQGELDCELARIDTSIGEIAREHQERADRAARCIVEAAAHGANAYAARAAAEDLRAQAEVLLRRAASLDEVARDAEAHAVEARRAESFIQAEVEVRRQRGLAAVAVREKVVQRHAQRTRADRRAAERLREKLDAVVGTDQ